MADFTTPPAQGVPEILFWCRDILAAYHDGYALAALGPNVYGRIGIVAYDVARFQIVPTTVRLSMAKPDTGRAQDPRDVHDNVRLLYEWALAESRKAVEATGDGTSHVEAAASGVAPTAAAEDCQSNKKTRRTKQEMYLAVSAAIHHKMNNPNATSAECAAATKDAKGRLSRTALEGNSDWQEWSRTATEAAESTGKLGMVKAAFKAAFDKRLDSFVALDDSSTDDNDDEGFT